MSVMSDHDHVSELLSIYRQAALEEAAASAIGDYRTATRHHTTIARVYAELRQRGPEATECLLDLCDDTHPVVRVSAAAHALEFAPARGQELLAQLVTLGGQAGRAAELALEDWRRGYHGISVTQW